MKDKETLRKQRQKRRKYRLLILLLLLFGTGTLLTTSTYAWFTSNKNVSVESLQVNIEAKNGIQISADGTNWKAMVQRTDLAGAKTGKYQAAVNQLPTILEPVSTAGVPDANGRLPMYYGVIETSETAAHNGQYILTTTKEEEKDDSARVPGDPAGKYIAFDLFFKVNTETQVYLNAGSGVTTTDAQDTGIKNAARIALVNLGNIADGSALDAIQALNNGATSTVTLWEQNYDVHTPAGVKQAKDVYGHDTMENGAPAISYKGVIDTITKAEDILQSDTSSETKFKSVDPTIKTVAGFTKNQALFSLPAGITKIRVYMWVEGQDVDCENNASGGTIKFDLKITTNAE